MCTLDCGEVDEPAHLRRAIPGGCDLLIVDHYDRDREFEAACGGWARHVAVIDDLPDRMHECDALIDQTPGRRVTDYGSHVSSTCMCLVGSRYALLDRGFAARRGADRRVGNSSAVKILVNFGHCEPAGVTAKVLHALDGSGAAADLVFGTPPVDIDDLRAAASRLDPPAAIHVDVADMAALMVDADLAVGAGGVTALERCCVGLPSLLVVLADNQRANAAALVALGAARLLGTAEDLTVATIRREVSALLCDPGARRAMSTAALSVTDGHGAERVSRVLIDLLAGSNTHPSAEQHAQG